MIAVASITLNSFKQMVVTCAEMKESKKKAKALMVILTDPQLDVITDSHLKKLSVISRLRASGLEPNSQETSSSTWSRCAQKSIVILYE